MIPRGEVGLIFANIGLSLTVRGERIVDDSLYAALGDGGNATDSVRISVKDRGIGVAKSEHKKIFEKFYRAEDSLVHETKGSGLGLSLVKHIMDAHGGWVEVDSSPGRGSTFTLVLPGRAPE